MEYHKTKLNGVELEIEGLYYKGTDDTYLEQGDAPEFEIFKVSVNGVKIEDVLYKGAMEEIEKKILTENY